MPKVSVVIPGYNCDAYIGATIESVLQQTYDDYEIIVVDDGSSDLTAQVVSHYGSDLVYIHQENLGTAAARNTGIQASSGDLVAFLDADDVWLPDKLERQVKYLDARQDVGVLHTSWYFYTPSREVFPYIKRVLTPIQEAREIILNNVIMTSSVVVRRQHLQLVGDFDTSIAGPEDLDFWLRCVANGVTFQALESPLVVYRLHEDSKTATLDVHPERRKIFGAFFATSGLTPALMELQGEVASQAEFSKARISASRRDYSALRCQVNRGCELSAYSEALVDRIALLPLPSTITGPDKAGVRQLSFSHLKRCVKEASAAVAEVYAKSPDQVACRMYLALSRRCYDVRAVRLAIALANLGIITDSPYRRELIRLLGKSVCRLLPDKRLLRMRRTTDPALDKVRRYVGVCEALAERRGLSR